MTNAMRRRLIARINRRLARQEQVLRVAQDADFPSLGRYYTVDWRRNLVVDRHIEDLSEYLAEIERTPQ